MEFNQLKPADILIFSGAKDWLSQSIMLLTNSEVTHSALYYRDPHQIIEETPPSIRIFELSTTGESGERLRGRKIYVNRLDGSAASQVTMTPVIEAATSYLNDETPYAKGNLYLLGLILIYKKWNPNPLVQQVTVKILKKLTARIIDYINQHKSPGKLPMVCSQFVYQCYEDAGEDYRLRLEQESLLSPVSSMPGHDLSLLERVMAGRPDDYSLQANLAREDVPPESEEELAQELMEALGSDLPPLEGLEPGLALALYEFGQAVYSAEGSEDNASPMMIARTEGLAQELHIPPLLTFLKVKEAYFVTPEDLLNHCQNLTRVGVMEL